MSRVNIPKRLRFAVLERDGFRCRYCGATAAEERLEMDHHTPVSAGGENSFENLLTACHPCNSGKSSFLPLRHIASQRERALAAMLFECVGERFGDEVPLWRAFATLMDFCISEPEPEWMLDIVTSSSSWAEALDRIYRFAGFPDEAAYGSVQ